MRAIFNWICVLPGYDSVTDKRQKEHGTMRGENRQCESSWAGYATDAFCIHQAYRLVCHDTAEWLKSQRKVMLKVQIEHDGLPSTAMSPPAVTLIFWPNQYVPGPGDLIFAKLAQTFTKILYSSGISGHCLCCDLDLWLLILNPNQHIYEPR